MTSALTVERVRRDVEVLAAAGLDLVTFLAEAEASLQRAVPHCASCMATVDPATELLTGTWKFGDLAGNDEHDHDWGRIEYGDLEGTTFTELGRRPLPAAGVHLETRGDPVASRRMRDLMLPVYDYTDELRLVARDGKRLWGGMAFFRHGHDHFTEEEVAFLASLSGTVAQGLRAGLLARIAAAPPPDGDVGPAVLIVGTDDRAAQVSVGAEARLAELAEGDNAAAATGTIAALVAGARRYGAGATDRLPRSRVRSRRGRWFVLHASPLAGRDGATGDVVVTIEEARPPEIVPLVVAAFDLTPREQDVTQLVLQGVDTKEIARTLHLSAYTVQDHLKSVFEKADVRSRRELIARVFFDQYAPRIGSEIAPMGWFQAEA
jgi:DNA-binding CsgD family transcriptional regulator